MLDHKRSDRETIDLLIDLPGTFEKCPKSLEGAACEGCTMVGPLDCDILKMEECWKGYPGIRRHPDNQ